MKLSGCATLSDLGSTLVARHLLIARLPNVHTLNMSKVCVCVLIYIQYIYVRVCLDISVCVRMCVCVYALYV